MKPLLYGMILCVGLLSGCRGDDEALTAKRPSKKAEQSTPSSVSTPPLELATTSEATGMTPPKSTSAAEGQTADAPDTVAFSPTPIKAQTNVIIVFDASGSMTGPIERGTKFDYVKSAMKDLLVQPAPASTKRTMGLRVFGSQHPVADQQCEDSRIVAELGKIDTSTIGPDIDALKAQGTSPIAHALQRAVANLPDADENTDNMIILLADGGDTCNADPCMAAQQIHEGRTQAMVHVIGFDLDRAAEEQLTCIAEKSDGRFFLARNVGELRTSADQALNANLPYNLRIKVFAGNTPLPAQMTVYRSGTRKVVEDRKTSGVKFFQLQPATYDIQITYDESVQEPKPSKLLKGVEVQLTARAEQVVYFDLGFLELAGESPTGEAVALTYTLHKPGDSTVLATIEGTKDARAFALTPGEYVVKAQGPAMNDIPLTATSDPLTIEAGKVAQERMSFAAGEAFLRAQSSRGDFVAASYAIALATDRTKTLAEGDIPAEGKALPLPVGEYVITLRPKKNMLQHDRPVTIEQFTVPKNDRVQELVTFPVGNLQLIGRDSEGQQTKTEFVVRRSHEKEILWQDIVSTSPATLILAPGLYHIAATRLEGKVKPAPVVIWEDVEIGEESRVTKEATFQLGTLQLLSKDAAGAPLIAEFTLFRPGLDAPLATQRTGTTPIAFRLTPGLYDVRAQDISATGSVKPTIWMHGLAVTANETSSQEVIFTSGRVRLTCRGTNETAIPCAFRLFTYGQDAPLFAAETLDNWEEFEMKPGTYYLEVDFNNIAKSHHIKKWINIKVAANTTVEQIVRF
jgi:Mg-chelatase subunit ChlD